MRGQRAGLGIVFGAALGMLLVLTVVEADLWVGLVLGGAFGLVVGAAWDAQDQGRFHDGDGY